MVEGHVCYFNIFEGQTKVSMKKKRKNYYLRNKDDGDALLQLGLPPHGKNITIAYDPK